MDIERRKEVTTGVLSLLEVKHEIDREASPIPSPARTKTPFEPRLGPSAPALTLALPHNAKMGNASSKGGAAAGRAARSIAKAGMPGKPGKPAPPTGSHLPVDDDLLEKFKPDKGDNSGVRCSTSDAKRVCSRSLLYASTMSLVLDRLIGVRVIWSVMSCEV